MKPSYDDVKYGSRNPFKRWLLERFLRVLGGVVERLGPGLVVDVGCGEGHLSSQLGMDSRKMVRLDLDHGALVKARSRLGGDGLYVQGSIDALPFRLGLPHAALCLEVLEHLAHPEDAVHELSLAFSGPLVVTVPNEPWFSLASLAGGLYWSRGGRHPGHCNAWSASGILRLLTPRFRILECKTPFPWSIIVCKGR